MFREYNSNPLLSRQKIEFFERLYYVTINTWAGQVAGEIDTMKYL